MNYWSKLFMWLLILGFCVLVWSAAIEVYFRATSSLH